MLRRPSRRTVIAAAVCGSAWALVLAIPAGADDDPWPGIRKDLFAERPVAEDAAAITLEAPVRAEDAAIVPITVRMPAETAAHVKALTLLVDKNPVPVVAKFTFGPAAGSEARMLATRVRIDSYSNVRAIAETDDGRLLMAARFVKAAGGCSAPALKDADEALANAGKMQIRLFASSEAQAMIRHPNYTGMQMNQVTGLYIPAKFIEAVEVKRGGTLVFRMEGGVSLSENPTVRFTYEKNGGEPLEAIAKDNAGNTFTAESAAAS